MGLLLVSRLLVEESNSFSEWGCDGFFPRSHFMLTVFCCVRGKCMLRVSTTEFCKPHRSKGALLIYIDRERGRERERKRQDPWDELLSRGRGTSLLSNFLSHHQKKVADCTQAHGTRSQTQLLHVKPFTFSFFRDTTSSLPYYLTNCLYNYTTTPFLFAF